MIDLEDLSANKSFFEGGKGTTTFFDADTELEKERNEATTAVLYNNDQAYFEMPTGGHNKLYHIVVSFRIPIAEKTVEFSVNAVIDTGCTCCCLNIGKVPKDALEDAKIIQNVSGVNSTTRVTKKLKQGKMILADQEFYTPYISVFEMSIPKIDMLIGCNFIRAMKGGIRIEGTEVTFYKTITRLQTTLEPQKIAYLEEVIAEEDLQLELANSAQDYESLAQKMQDSRIIKGLHEQGYIGDNPVKHWGKNKIKCKLEIINPDITIEDRPPGHLTTEEKARYQKHIDTLLELGVIRPSKSRHRTAAFIVKSGTSIDPLTGKEIKGKERMVYNYKMLNDNTYKDQYSLPGINSIIKSLGNAKVFSKFDLKSGFHQVAMDEESIPWTAFISPAGLYEWLVMPFGLKNAPAVFQRKMDDCFRGTEGFIAVYIDDILVFSQDLQQHEEHLKVMLEICQKNGLVLSPTKMKLACQEVEFLGATIRLGKIKLQPHIIKKIVEVPEDSLQSLKGLRSWLGIINYARAYIPKCGTLLGPLYSKTSEHGERKWKKSDWEIVQKIKQTVQQLPDLEIPPQESYVVIETDGCMEGWGGVCKWKTAKAASQGSEKICSYASGKFSVPKSTIDAEIFAVMESLEKFKIFYLDKREITLRTDCQAIIAFYEKMAVKKPSRIRWIGFCDYITNTGIQVHFEHIKGENNQLADQLSRLAQQVCQAQVIPEEAHEALITLLEGNCTHLGLITQFNKLLRKQRASYHGPPVWYEKRKEKQKALVLLTEAVTHTARYFHSFEAKEPLNHGYIYRNEDLRKSSNKHSIMPGLPIQRNMESERDEDLQPTARTQGTAPRRTPVGRRREAHPTDNPQTARLRQGSREFMIRPITADPLMLRYHELATIEPTSERPIPLDEHEANRDEMHQLQEQIADRAVQAVRNLVTLLEQKREACRRTATRDNYWNDVLPTVTRHLGQGLEIETLLENLERAASDA